MTPLAWIFMLGTWSLVIGCTLYCFWRLMSSKSLSSDE